MSIGTKDLTGGEREGAGLFDELMRTVKDHLQAEFEKGRIHGADYANVYLGSLQATLSVAAQYVLQAPLTSQQILLLQEQIRAAEQDVLLKADQLLTAAKQRDLLDAQILTEQKQAVVLEKQALNLDKDILIKDEQIAKLQAETALLGEQLLTQRQQTLLVTEQVTSETYNNTFLLPAQLAKLEAETALLERRLDTETAQTSDTLADGVTPVSGLVGQELALKTAQADSFARDAEQKAAKFYADVYSIIFSTNPDNANSDPYDWGLDPVSATKVMSKLRAGIDVT